MANPEQQDLQTLLQTIAHEEGESFTSDAARIEKEAYGDASFYANLPIKLLTIFGGFLAAFFLLGFLFSAGLYESELGVMLSGIALLIGAEVLNRQKNEVLLGSMSAAFNIMGYFMFGMGLGQLSENETILALSFIAIAVAFILLSESTVFVFLAVLVLNGSLISLILIHKTPNMLHLFIGLATAALTYLSMQEADLISRHVRFNKLYPPVRMGLVFSLIGALVLLAHQNLAPMKISFIWVSSLVLIAAILVVLRRIMHENAVTNVKVQAVVYASVCLMLLPTIFTPSIAGALLVVLCSFYIGHRVSFVAGLLALGYFIILYYYNLQLTLLQKSGILVLTGCLFLAALYLLNRYLRSHAK